MIMKYTKRISALFCAVMLTLCSGIYAFAASYTLIDDAMLFDSEQTEILMQEMERIGEKTGWEIVVYTNTNYVDSDDMEYYYNQFYDDNGFSKDGVIFVIDRGYDNRVINTKGDAMYYFSDERMTGIKSELKPYLVDEDWYGATMKFLEVTESYYDDGKPEGEEFTNVKLAEKEANPLIYALKHYGIIAGVIGLAAATITVIIIGHRYKNNGKEGTYDLHANSKTNLTDKQDIFLRKSVTVVNESSSSSSDGSSHSSSGGGSSHGSSGSF